MNRTMLAVGTVVALLTLAGCGSETNSAAVPTTATSTTATPTTSAPTTSAPTTTTPTTTTVPPNSHGNIDLRVGETFTVPCDYTAETECMQITFTSVKRGVACNIPVPKKGAVLAVGVEAKTLTSAAVTDFFSPFRSFPWSAITLDGEIIGISNELLCDSTKLNLMKEVPGTTAKATIYFDSSADFSSLVFQPHHGTKYELQVPR